MSRSRFRGFGRTLRTFSSSATDSRWGSDESSSGANTLWSDESRGSGADADVFAPGVSRQGALSCPGGTDVGDARGITPAGFASFSATVPAALARNSSVFCIDVTPSRHLSFSDEPFSDSLFR